MSAEESREKAPAVYGGTRPQDIELTHRECEARLVELRASGFTLSPYCASHRQPYSACQEADG